MNRYEEHSWITDQDAAEQAGYGCGLCLDFGHLEGLGSCPACRRPEFDEHLVEVAVRLTNDTWAEEHDGDPLGWCAA